MQIHRGRVDSRTHVVFLQVELARLGDILRGVYKLVEHAASGPLRIHLPVTASPVVALSRHTPVVVELLLLGRLGEDRGVRGCSSFLVSLHLLTHLLHPVVRSVCLIHEVALLVLSVSQPGVLPSRPLLLLNLTLRIPRLDSRRIPHRATVVRDTQLLRCVGVGRIGLIIRVTF